MIILNLTNSSSNFCSYWNKSLFLSNTNIALKLLFLLADERMIEKTLIEIHFTWSLFRRWWKGFSLLYQSCINHPHEVSKCHLLLSPVSRNLNWEEYALSRSQQIRHMSCPVFSTYRIFLYGGVAYQCSYFIQFYTNCLYLNIIK